MTRTSILVQGMHGLGDNLHQRAVIRQLMKTHDVVLETSWASLYHDLVADGLRLIRRRVNLRTQSKNADREARSFLNVPPRTDSIMRISYHGANVMKTPSGSVLEAMCNVTGTDYSTADYRLPIPEQWFARLEETLAGWRHSGKPLLVYRPLVARPEWRGSAVRNADPVSYAKLFATIRDEFYVISVADLAPGKEWIVSPVLQADLALHSGELNFEELAALFSVADLVFTSSGFAAILAPAVGTPCVSVVGGYESAAAHSSGTRFAPMIAFQPRQPCNCWTSSCPVQCDKSIVTETAIPELQRFVSANVGRLAGFDWGAADVRPVESMFAAQAPEPELPRPAPPRQSAAYMSYLAQVRASAKNTNGETA